jgi:hypothetical protein
MKVKLLKRDIERCERFAEKRMNGSKDEYKARGELRESKIFQDIVTGACGEIAVYRYLKNQGIESTKPDFKIYEKRKKSFDADLISEVGNLHVKSQTLESANKYGASWLFQKWDPLLKDDHLKDYMVFCIVDDREVTIEHICHIKDIIDNDALDEPKVWRYKHTKHAIYLDHVKELNNLMEEI